MCGPSAEVSIYKTRLRSLNLRYSEAVFIVKHEESPIQNLLMLLNIIYI